MREARAQRPLCGHPTFPYPNCAPSITVPDFASHTNCLRRDLMTVVIVESPAKAKTINKYLGKGYTVLASFGHVRDLPSKDGSVRPDEDFAMSWEVEDRADKRLKDIA